MLEEQKSNLFNGNKNYEIHFMKNFKTLLGGMKNQIPSKTSALARYCYTAIIKSYVDKLNKMHHYDIDVEDYAF